MQDHTDPTDAEQEAAEEAAEEARRVLARLSASDPRRVIGVVILGALGALLLYLAFWHPPASLLWRFFLVGFGLFTLFGCARMWQATKATLELTRNELRERAPDGTLRQVTAVTNIRSISRGALAIKPSNGFSLSLKTRGERAWAPGLWWRTGRQVGIGGVTASAEARFMAETIAGLLPKDP